MKCKYKGYEIEVYRDRALGGWDNVYYSVFRESDGYEATSGFYDGSCKVKDVFKGMKEFVDEYCESNRKEK